MRSTLKRLHASIPFVLDTHLDLSPPPAPAADEAIESAGRDTYVSSGGLVWTLQTGWTRGCRLEQGYYVVHWGGAPIFVHRLVAGYFLDEERGRQDVFVVHIDGDLKNNRADNLSWQCRRRGDCVLWGVKNTPLVVEPLPPDYEPYEPYSPPYEPRPELLELLNPRFDPRVLGVAITAVEVAALVAEKQEEKEEEEEERQHGGCCCNLGELHAQILTAGGCEEGLLRAVVRNCVERGDAEGIHLFAPLAGDMAWLFRDPCVWRLQTLTKALGAERMRMTIGAIAKHVPTDFRLEHGDVSYAQVEWAMLNWPLEHVPIVMRPLLHTDRVPVLMEILLP